MYFESMNLLAMEKCSETVKSSTLAQRCFVIEVHRPSPTFLTPIKVLVWKLKLGFDK